MASVGRPTKQERGDAEQLAAEFSSRWYRLAREAGHPNVFSFAKHLYATGSPYLAHVMPDKGPRRQRLRVWLRDLEIYEQVRRGGARISRIARGKKWSTIKSAFERAALAIEPGLGMHFQQCSECQVGRPCSVYERLIKVETGEKASLSYARPVSDLSTRQVATVMNLLDGTRTDSAEMDK
jgi:hypothetical protein